ncbi:hypothetical protein [Methanothermococcus okinawensis]|uniref:Uncharacterized protein n=1 Tax=Methanothermococcus okinawensis (strain DSM 14208 / JCM 11175 / IH1) TaxID=647113 RepID=F8AKQ5_METOI|nr:hypothetical protein [Methanothermococcus okinawensis]AEH06392.1 hypothetical protein Metok_0405 [Methanothermococcus okinawensis IH1]
MRKIMYYIIFMGLLINSIQGIYGNDIEISNIWESNTLVNLNNGYGKYYIDVDISPSIYVTVINHDSYQHNIILNIKSDEETPSWQSPITPITPNSKKGKVICAKLKFKESGFHKVYISILDENKKILASKTATVYVANPIDIEYISCSDSYINKSNPNIEICNSPWFKIGLKNNKYSQSDYVVKTWIAVVSKDYTKDASKNKNDAGVLYYGENDSKLVYVPKGGESEVSFKIPPISQNDDELKIQVHTSIMGVHDYADGPANTKIKGSSNSNIAVYSRNISNKIFFYPIILKNFEVVTKLNKSTVNILKKYYRDSNIKDDELETMIDHYNYYSNYNDIPRAYLKTEPYLAIVKLTLKNRYNNIASGTISIKNDMHSTTKYINMSGFETREVYMPCYINYSGNKQINITICSAGCYNYIETKNLDISPKKIPIVIIKNITYSYDTNNYIMHNNYADVLVGRTYIMKVTLVNNYNKTLSGNISIKSKFKKVADYYPSETPFTLGARAEKIYYIPIRFNRGANGDLQFTIKTNNALAEFSKTIHFNAHNVKAELYYNDTLNPKIAVANENPVFKQHPVAGCYNTFTAKLDNPLNEKIKCLTWVKVVRGDGHVNITSPKKIIYIPPKGFKTVNFKIKFNEGFNGHILLYAIPTINYNENISNTTPLIVKTIDVVAPLSISNLTYNNSLVHAEIVSNSSNEFPVSIQYNYWIELIKNNVSIFKTKTHTEIITPRGINHIHLKLKKLDNGNYTLKLYVEIPKFIKDNGMYRPMILEKSENIIENGIHKNNTGITQTPISDINNSVDTHSISGIFNHSIPKNENNTTVKKISLFNTIYSFIKNLISTVF